METYLIYIAKTAIAAGAFYIAFLLLFQNQKHFTFNRIYLPVSLALSFVIPLITFTTVKYIEPANFDANSFAYLAPASGEIVQPAFVFEWYHYLFGLYLLGTAGFLFHLLLGHLKAINIIQKSRIQKIFNNLVNITQKDVHPFSFFSKIVVSEKTLSHPDLEMIVSHENIHVREKHTLDILFTEIMFLLQWFNPFAWLLKDAVKNNLEYLTDHEIAQHYNAKTYQLAMVTLADKQGIAPFLTALNGSQLKNRIVMMKKKTENKYAFLKQLVVLPLLAVLVMGLSNREVKTEIVQNINQNEISGSKILIKGKVTDQKGDPISGASVIVKGTTTGTITDPKGNYELSLDNKNKTLSFIVPDFETINIDVNGQNIIDVQLKSDESDKNSVVKVNTSGTQNFSLEKEDKHIVSGKVTNENVEPLSGVNSQMKDRLESDTTVKSDTIKIVGYKSTESQQSQNGGFTISGGMNGTMQKGSENVTITPSTQNGITIKATGGLTGQPIYFVDGVEATSTILNELSPDSIESISVLKDKSATALYGEKGKNGVILITTKKFGQNNKSGNVTVGYGNYAALLGNPAPFGSATGKTNQPLIIVNGKESGQSLNNIDPATIESVYVLKNEKATEKYGEKGKNGVIEIITKAKYTTCDDGPSFYMSVENSKVLELRKKIAQTIKYPVVAQENNQQGVVEVWAFIAKDGTISRITDKRPDGKFINVDEVVVTALKSEKAVTSEKSNNLELLVKESKRVIEKLSPLKIPELAGETVSFRIRFVLQ